MSKTDTSHDGRDTDVPPSQMDSFLPYPESAVAITGMACKFAGADSVEELWKVLETGTLLHRDLPKDRFPDHRFQQRSSSRRFKANMIDDVDAFDHKFFDVSTREAAYMDPQQRIALQVTYQALESSGYFSRDTPRRDRDMGCYMATSANEYADNIATHPASAFSIIGSTRPFIAGRISHHFGWTGPAIMYDTACASSCTAIHQACRAVATGECDGAIAGATNIFVSPEPFQNLAHGHFTSPTRPSRPFDAEADGYCRGEGVAVIVLKKLSAALRDGDPIMGVLAATAVNQNSNASPIAVPHGPSQVRLYKKALELAGLDARDVSYVEAHGTGTPVGDPIEAQSIRQVFGNQHQDGRKTYLGSIKSNIGHTEATSGMSGLIKVLLMMQKGYIPPQALFNTLNPDIGSLDTHSIEIADYLTPWTSEFKVACVNNYGVSGTNAVMIVTQPPPVCRTPSTATRYHAAAAPKIYPISVTAFSKTSLKSYCSSLLDFISQSDITDEDALLKNMAYHLCRKRNAQLLYSFSTRVCSLQELKQELHTVSRSSLEEDSFMQEQSPVVMFFGGQGLQTPAIPRVYYESCTVFRKHLDACDEVIRALGAPGIFPAVFVSNSHDDVVLSHATLFSSQYAAAMSWIDCGLQPARLIGHSFGQITAMCVSGILSLRDSLRLVIGRARLVRDLWGQDKGSMITVATDLNTITSLLLEHADLGFEIACYNGPQSFVIAGASSSVDVMESILSSSPDNIQWKRLPVSHAFHTHLVDPLLEPMQNLVEELHFQTPTLPVETCSEDSMHPSKMLDFVASHPRDPVYFQQAAGRIAQELGPCVWLNTGSVTGMSMLKRAFGGQDSPRAIISLDWQSDYNSLHSLAQNTADLWQHGQNVQFWHFHHSQNHQYDLLFLPPYQFDKTRHWLEWRELNSPLGARQGGALAPDALLELKQRTAGGGEFSINPKSRQWLNACSDERLLGVAFCPLAFILDLVCKALDVLQGLKHSSVKKGPYHVENLFLQSPIAANLQSNLSLLVSEVAVSHSWTFVLKNHLDSSQALASGSLSLSAGNDRKSKNEFARFERLVGMDQVHRISNDAQVDSVRGKAVYKSIANVLRVYEGKQVIQQLSAKGHETAAHLTLEASNLCAAIDRFVQVPFISLNSLQDCFDEETYVFTGTGQIKVHNTFLSSSMEKKTSYAMYVKFFELGGDEAMCDAFVFDSENKQLVAVILDVVYTRIYNESLKSVPIEANFLDSIITRDVEPVATTPELEERCSQHSAEEDRMPQTPSSPLPVELQSIRAKVVDLLVRIADVDPDVVQDDMRITDLGIDSLMGIEVAEEIRNVFSIAVTVREVDAVDNVVSLCRLIAERVQGLSPKSDETDTDDSDRTLSTFADSTRRHPKTEHESTGLWQNSFTEASLSPI